MLTIFSDLHLTDESASVNINPEAFTSILGPQILNSAGNKNADEVNIVMLGDIFDLVRSDYWLQGDVPPGERPWGGVIDKTTGMNSHHMVEEHYKNILNKIIDTGAAGSLLDMLNRVKAEAKVPVKITFVPGNHDRAFNNFVSLKQILIAELHNFSTDEIIFTNMFKDERYSTICRHGHEFDENNFGFQLYKLMNRSKSISQFDEKIYKVQSIGEPITAELMSGMIYRVKKELGENNEFVKMIKDINNVRPVSKAILWMHWIGTNRKLVRRSYMQKLLVAFRDSMEALLETPLTKKWDETRIDFVLSGDITDTISKLSKIIEYADLNSLQGFMEVFGFFDKIFGGRSDSVEEGANKEFSLKSNKNIQYVFMGHTHEAKQSFFKSTAENFLNLYINTGTYLPLILQTLNGSGFSSVHQMTMAFVYNTDEDYNRQGGKPNKFPTLDLWNGIRKKEY